jgi:hypothetical protein
VDRDGIEALAVQPRREPRRGQLGPGEDEHLAQVSGADQVRKQRFLAVAIDREDELVDRFGRRVPGRHLDGRGVAQDGAGEPPDVVGERRREHEVLPAGREQRDDPLDIREEAHVEHPVGLIEDEDLDLTEVGHPLADQVEQAARRGDEDLDTGAERLDLRVHRDAAVDHRGAQRDGPAIRRDALVDLHRELAGRDEDQHADGMPRG